jgi:serine/threonine-protein kinase
MDAATGALDATQVLGSSDPGETGLSLAQTALGAHSPTPLDGRRLLDSMPVIHLGDPVSKDQLGGPELVLGALLGEGGLGRVYSARERGLDREVAVKVLRAKPSTREAVSAIVAEALIGGGIEHPCVVPVHRLGRDRDGDPVLVMKRVVGLTWHDLMAQPDHAAWGSVAGANGDRLGAHLSILLQVCSAVVAAHEEGIVHRDLKPMNVMVGRHGDVYVVDWGASSRLSGPRSEDPDGPGVQGTPAYMAPEQISRRAGPVDERTDVYLLGGILHEVLTGRPPHDGTTLRDVLQAAWESLPPVLPASVPTELSEIVRKALSANRDERYPTARAFRDAILVYLAHRAAIALTTAAEGRLQEARDTLASGDDAKARATASRFATEARYGFEQALREWPGSPGALLGLDASTEVLVELELRRRQAAAARELLSGLKRPNAELTGRVDQLELELEREHADDQRRRALEQDLDLTLSARHRVAAYCGLNLLAFVFLLTIWVNPTPDPPSFWRSIDRPLLMGLGIALTAFFGRKHLLRNAANRRVFLLLALTVASMFFHRLIAVYFGLSLTVSLLNDALVLAATSAVAALFVAPWAVWMMVVMLIVAGAMVAWPTASEPLLAVGVVAVMSLASVLDYRATRPKGP